MKKFILKIKNLIWKRKFCLLFIIILISGLFYFFSESQSYKYKILYQYQTVPFIELKNNLYNYGPGIFGGEVVGFVKFDDLENQPKDMQQYYIIKPLDKFDSEYNQYYSLDVILKLNSLAPSSLGISEMVSLNETKEFVTLEDEGGNLLFINKITEEISMKDVTGETSLLITDSLDYKDFILEFKSL